jgi:hypothetical protein
VNGQVSIFDKKNKKFGLVAPEEYDPYRHELLTFEDAVKRQKDEGFFNPEDPYTPNHPLQVTMASDKDVISYINGVLQGAGSESGDNTIRQIQKGVTSMMDLVSTKFQSNSNQLNSKMKAILGASGLPENYWDTLKSNAYSRLMDQNHRLPSEKEANKAAVQFLSDLVGGNIKTDIENSTSDMSTAARAMKEGVGNTKTSDLGFYAGAVAGEQGADADVTTHEGQPQRKGKALNDALWETYHDENGVPLGKAPLNQNRVLNKFVPAGEEFRTVSGNVKIDPSMAIPALGSNTEITVGKDGNQYLVFDAYVEDDGIEDLDKVTTKDTNKADEKYIEDTAEQFYEARDKNKTTVGFDPYESAHKGLASFFKGDSYHRVRVRVAYSPSLAQTLTHTLLDKNSMKIPEAGITIGGGKKPSPNVDRPLMN